MAGSLVSFLPIVLRDCHCEDQTVSCTGWSFWHTNKPRLEPYFCGPVYITGILSFSSPEAAPRIATSGQVQRHSGFEWICKHNRLRPEPIRFVRLDSKHAQSDGKSVNRGLPLLDLDRARGLARGRDSWC